MEGEGRRWNLHTDDEDDDVAQMCNITFYSVNSCDSTYHFHIAEYGAQPIKNVLFRF